MSDDRLAQARAEAERRWPRRQSPGDPYPEDRYRRTTMDRRIGFEQGVEWADANPQPTTITREELDAFKIAWETADGLGLAGGRVEYAMKRIGIEVEDSDE